MISIILSFIFTAQASVYTPVLSVTDLSKKMETELQTLQRLATKLSDKALMSEIERERQGREDFALKGFVGVPLIPVGISILASKRGDKMDESYDEFLNIWGDNVWSYVLLFEQHRRDQRK